MKNLILFIPTFAALLLSMPAQSQINDISEIEIIGPDALMANTYVEYGLTFRDLSGNIIANPPPPGSVTWMISLGVNADVIHNNGYTGIFNWSKPGEAFVYCEVTINGTTYYDEYQILINSLIPPTPSASVAEHRGCLSTTVSVYNIPEKVNYDCYWQTTATGTSTALNAITSIILTSPGPLYLRAKSKDAPYNWSVQSQFIGNFEITTSTPPAPDNSTNGYIIGNGRISLSVSPATGATSYRWYTQQTGGSLIYQGSNTYSFTAKTTTDFWVSSINLGCESSHRIKVSAIVYPAPIVTATNDGIIDNGEAVTIYVNNSTYDSYTWISPTGQVLEGITGASYTTDQPGTYKIKVTKGPALAYTTPTGITLTSTLSALDQNYTTENNFLRPGITPNTDIDNLETGEVSRAFKYYDGIGRLIQAVTMEGSPQKKDLIQPIAYDEIGREDKKYLPYADKDAHNGRYKKNALKDPNTLATSDHEKYISGAQYLFYNANNTENVSQDTRPYFERIFEESPLNRPLAEYAEGNSWRENNKSISYAYLTNLHGTNTGQEKIIAWRIDNTGQISRETSHSGYITEGGFFNTGQLFVKQTTDEAGHVVREYSDKLKRLILKKIQASKVTSDLNNTASWALTYYIYDNLGNLRYIFQPELSRVIHQNDGYVPTLLDLNSFAFQYRYDYRNRMSEKKTPGQDWIYMVYNSRDQLILTQDGNQRAGSPQYWTFTKYDGLGRPVLTGIKDTTVALIQPAMQQVVNTFYTKPWARVFEIYTGNADGNVHGYTDSSYPVVTTSGTLDVNRIVAVTYYDNYDFKTLWSYNYSYQSDALQSDANNFTYKQPASESRLVIGKATGSKVKVLDGGITGGYSWLKSVNYYDDKYRVIQVLSDNYKGGVDRVSNLYDFVGKVLKTKTTHQQTDVAQWKDLVGVSITGNKITRTVTGSNWGVSGLASVESMPANTDGWVELTASEENTLRMLGLSATNADASYPSIGYAFYLRNDKTLWVYEGTSKGQIAGGYKTGDILRIQRVDTRIKYFRNGIDVSPVDASQIASSAPLYVDIALGSSQATIINVKSSFSGGSYTLTKRFTYDHVGRPLSEYHSIDGQDEVELVKNEYNELGQLVDKKLHSIAGAPFKQSIDYRYNIRGWLTNINNSRLDDGENDYFGMNLAYNEEQGTGNGTFVITPQGQVGSYTLNGNATDASTQHLDGVVHGAVAAQDQQGNAGQAYAFGSEDYIEIPDSKAKHSFIQNTGKFTIAAFVKIDDLSARSVILSSTATSANKGFLFMYETYGGTFGDHQLRFTITNGQPGVSSITLGAKNTINDTNWHHVAVVGDGTHIRFYVDGAQDGPPTSVALLSTGDASYATLIGKSRTTNGALFLGMTGSMDEVNIFERAFSQREVQALSQRATAGSTIAAGQYNGNISGIKWSVNQGIGDIKEMAYNFDYDPMNRLTSATNLQSGGSQLWQTGNYGEGGLLYDLNGNIKNLMRHGDATGIMDNLTYNYGTTSGNQLLKVTDTGDKFTGFTDGVNTTNDYTYDANGNMLTDLNKGMSTAITYNYLNLPELVVRSTGSVRYIYDAAGRKLAQVATYGNLPKQTDYVGEFQYENDDLQFINHEEGRIVVSETELVYSIDGSTADPAAGVNATLTTVTANGDQTYLMARATSATARSGIFPIGETFPVQPGERYRIRARGYRDKGSVATANAAYILAQANGMDLAWPGAALQSTNTTEAWVEQIVTIPTGATELQAGVVWGTVLEGNTIYLNDFEITRLSDTEPEYQYFLKDHLGNVRLTFTTKDQTETSLATLEETNKTNEQGKFIYYDEAIKLYSNLFDHTNNGPTRPSGPFGDPDAPDNSPAGYATLLRGGANERYGLAKSLSVMPGDTIKMEVYAKYLDPTTASWSTQLADLMTSVTAGGSAPAGTLIDGGAPGSIGGTAFPLAGLLTHTQDQTDGPKAYLNWIIFDKDYQYKDGGYIALSQTAAESGQNIDHERLAHNFTAKEPGYIYVYLSNESETTVDVFFDDFKVEHMKSPVIQTEDYYPFGLTFNSYQRENTLNQQYLFGGKEKQSAMELGWMDHGARMYMPDLGRWGVLDPHAGKYEITSPYNYAFNNPLLFNDPTGKDNTIYLIGQDINMDINGVADLANQMLKDLALDQIRVVVYDAKKNGKFDPNKLSSTDSWAVIGSNRKRVANMARAIDRLDKRTNRERYPDGTTDYEYFVTDWENYAYKHLNPEISDRGLQDSSDGKGRGISVDTEDLPDGWKKEIKIKTFWASFNTIHGAGHNAGAGHSSRGVMSIGQDLANQWSRTGSRELLDINNNSVYIKQMKARFSSIKHEDKYGKN